MQKNVEVLESQPASQGFFTLKRLKLRHSSYHGGWCEPVVRERLEELAAASVLLYDPAQDAVVLVEQFRVGMLGQQDPPWSMETVSGYCDQAHEQPEDVARREVKEETGCELLALKSVGSFFVSPGFSVERIYLFVGQVDSRQAQGIHGLAEEGEEIRVVVLPREEAQRQLFGQLASTSILVALQWLQIHRDALLQEWGITVKE